MEKQTEDYSEADDLHCLRAYHCHFIVDAVQIWAATWEKHTLPVTAKCFPGIPDILSWCVKIPQCCHRNTTSRREERHNTQRSPPDVRGVEVTGWADGPGASSHLFIMKLQGLSVACWIKTPGMLLWWQVMTSSLVCIHLPRSELPAFVGHINVLFKKACRASMQSFTEERWTRLNTLLLTVFWMPAGWTYAATAGPHRNPAQPVRTDCWPLHIKLALVGQWMKTGSRCGENCLSISGHSTYSCWSKKVFVESFSFSFFRKHRLKIVSHLH